MEIASYWYNRNKLKQENTKNIKGFLLNFGPQHPAAHGVLRLTLLLNGELIEQSDPQIGFLHRGTEKLIEYRNYLQSMPYIDRLDYTSVLIQTHAYCLAIEKLSNNISYINTYTQIRAIFDELSRLLNHFLAISTHSLDVGNMSPLFWAFEEREKIMEFYERISGARMHAAFYRPFELDLSGLNYNFFLDLIWFLRDCSKSLIEIFSILNSNKIWKTRLIDIGILTNRLVMENGATGPIARSTGIQSDLRISHTRYYSNYWFLTIRSFLGQNGDCYDRFLIRIREMFESLKIIYQIISNLFNSSIYKLFGIFKYLELKNYNLASFKNKYSLLGILISHFNQYSTFCIIPKGVIYQSIESGKGEFGISIIADGSYKPYRCKIKSPAYNHLQLMISMTNGHYFADMITILGSQDIVFGEVDR